MHRLDKETSGVLVLAKTREVLQNLNRQLKFKKIRKTYLALVKGELKELGSIQLRLTKQFNRQHWKELMVVDRHHGIHAQTDYRRLEMFETSMGKMTLVEAYPVTGRMHQIRAHFAAIQHPIIGDSLYGDFALNKQCHSILGFTRQFLHCAQLQLTHPLRQSQIQLQAPLAIELKNVLLSLRASQTQA
jgi:RluA family pseudouridine synthase